MNNPLVSIVVITYNSSKFIFEGLESIRLQTYKNIEVIISDDCSTDNTVEICQSWLNENKEKFVSTKLIRSPINTGVAGNLNRGIRAAKGDWIKTLSGDDKFFTNSIDSYVKYIVNNPESNVIFGKLFFYGPNAEYVARERIIYENRFYSKIKLDQHAQYIENLKGLFVPGPGLIYRRVIWEKVGGYDEEYPFCEEDPFMFKILKSGIKIEFLEQFVYMYQVNIISLGRKDGYKTKLTRHHADRIKFFFNIRRKEMLKSRLFLCAYDETMSYKLIKSKADNKPLKIVWYFILKCCSPYLYLKLLKLI